MAKYNISIEIVGKIKLTIQNDRQQSKREHFKNPCPNKNMFLTDYKAITVNVWTI